MPVPLHRHPFLIPSPVRQKQIILHFFASFLSLSFSPLFISHLYLYRLSLAPSNKKKKEERRRRSSSSSMAAASSCNFLMQVPFLRDNPSSSSSSTGSRPSSSLISRHPPSSFKNPHPSLHHHLHNPSSPFQFPLLSVSMARPPSPISSSAESTHHPTFVDPSLRHANVLFFKSAYNVQVVVEDNEPEEALLRRFRREVMRAGVIQECKRRRHFENKQEEKKRRVRDAAKRNKRRRSRPRFLSPTDGDTASKKKPVPADDQEDNWEMPEGGLPY